MASLNVEVAVDRDGVPLSAARAADAVRLAVVRLGLLNPVVPSITELGLFRVTGELAGVDVELKVWVVPASNAGEVDAIIGDILVRLEQLKALTR